MGWFCQGLPGAVGPLALAGLAAGACTPGSGEPPTDQPSRQPAAEGGEGAAPDPADGDEGAAPDPAESGGEGASPTEPMTEAACAEAFAEYRELRASLNHCEIDSDCAEIWPGVCPHGPYYIDRGADVSELFALVDRIEDGCLLPDCEQPMRLDPARCDAGKCVEGRTPPAADTCWDFRLEYLASGRRHSTETVAHQQGITARAAVGVAEAGEMSVTVHWGDCPDCALRISEHNSGMANLVDGERTRVGERETIELPVTPGPYFMMAMSPTSPHPVTVTVDLIDEAGRPAQTNLHGVAWQRVCED